MNGTILIVKHVEQEGPGLIESFFAGNGWRLDTIELGRDERLPDAVDDYAAAVVLGGPMNVYEVNRYPFLEAEENLIRKLLISETPLLGICLGAQLLAKTCGAKVKKASPKEVGWYTLRVTDEGMKDGLFRDSSRRLKVFQWHEDTFDMPAGGVLLVQGKTCRNQAFRVGRNAYGVQFHTEVTASMIEEWMKEEEGKIDTGKILRDTREVKEAYEHQAHLFLLNFRRLIESSMRVKKIMKLFVEDEGKGKKKPVAWWNGKSHSPAPAKGV
jgi:GMP synthase-like glutamine amidotransferase